MVRGNAPRDGRLDVSGGDADDVVEGGVRIRSEGQPARGGGVEVSHVHVGSAVEVGDGFRVGIHVAAASSAFDGHVADGHAFLHRHPVEDIAGVFVGVADAALGAQQTDDVEDDVFRVNARGEVASHLDAANLEFLQGKRLGGQHVADLGGADSESDRTESPVRGGVRVPAGDRGARLGDALLRADDVDDPLLPGREVEVGDAEVIGIRPQRLHHFRRQRVLRSVLVHRRDDVIDGGEGALGKFHLEPEIAEHAERLWRCHLVDEVCADEELRPSIGNGADGVSIPDFLEEAFSHVGGYPPW